MSETQFSTQEVVDAYRRAVLCGDWTELLAAYADDAVLLTLEGPVVGKEAICRFYRDLCRDEPNARVSFGREAVAGDTALLLCAYQSEVATAPYVVATLLVREGKISRQTVWSIRIPLEP